MRRSATTGGKSAQIVNLVVVAAVALFAMLREEAIAIVCWLRRKVTGLRGFGQKCVRLSAGNDASLGTLWAILE
uniref:hypothetical protein n=1 Tax=Bifidobacterium adolescentis TaxID=1680 RepID=UPI003FF0FCBD